MMLTCEVALGHDDVVVGERDLLHAPAELERGVRVPVVETSRPREELDLLSTITTIESAMTQSPKAQTLDIKAESL